MCYMYNLSLFLHTPPTLIAIHAFCRLKKKHISDTYTNT